MKELVQKIKNYDEDFSKEVLEYFDRQSNYLNFKIKKIKTNENNQVNNPSHEINFDCKNYWILGDINTGKTTFFDKLYDFFLNPFEYGSPIKNNIINNSTLHLQSELEDKILQITIKSNSDNKSVKILLNSNLDIKSLENYGLLNNNLNLINFITQKVDDDEFFKKTNFSISNFFNFSQNYLVDMNIIQIKKILENQFRDILDKKIKNEKNLASIELNITNVKDEIETVNEKLENIDLFLKKKDEINLYLDNYEKDKHLEDLMEEKKKLTKKIENLRNRLKRQKIVHRYEKKTFELTDKYIRDLYFEYNPYCPICGHYGTLKSFRDRLEEDQCYLCGLFQFDYLEDQDKENDDISVDNDSEKNLKIKIKELDNERLRKTEKINNLLDNKKEKEINQELKKALNFFYIDIIRPGFTIAEETKRKRKLKKNFEFLLKEKRQELDLSKNKKKKLSEKNEKFNTDIRTLKSAIEDIENEAEKQIKILINEIKDSISSYWKEITKDPIGDIFYNPEPKSLEYVTVSNNDKPWPNRIKNVKKDNQLSDSALNALRYSIHLSFLKVLYDNKKKLPLKAIIIDTPDFEINKSFFKVINEDFVKERDFQIIILTTNKEEQFQSWNEKRFDKYEKRKKMDSKVRQMMMDYYLNKKR